jgi:hypothetical protein
MEELKFYDLKGRKKFKSKKYDLVKKKNPRTGKTTYFAKCKAPSKVDSYRIVSEDFYKKNKK